MRLFYFEYCDNSHGTWTREWFAKECEADAARAAKLTELDGMRHEEMCGEYGDVDVVQEVPIELTRAGVLAFANNFGQGD